MSMVLVVVIHTTTWQFYAIDEGRKQDELSRISYENRVNEK